MVTGFGHFRPTSTSSHDTIGLFLRLIFLHPVDSSVARQQGPSKKANPRKFDYAKPMKQWRKDWPESYHRMLHNLKEKWSEGRGVQEFVRILQLHKEYPANLLEQAIEQALSYGCVHLDGVLHCLHQLTEPKEAPASLDLSDRPHLQDIGNQPVDLSRYEKLLKYSW